MKKDTRKQGQTSKGSEKVGGNRAYLPKDCEKKLKKMGRERKKRITVKCAESARGRELLSKENSVEKAEKSGRNMTK